ncbi:MAG: hypothetical protein P4L56_15165 [Candidatus Sulfopaludibacter sp.]|nr:hypothetical protein [Candidatus Sulfopaludibacter sp.]
MENPKTHFILKGFSQAMEFRVFEFEGLMANSVRASFTVKIDIGLARKYGIRLQELPLLCRGVLDQHSEGEEQRSFLYTEAHMSEYAYNLAAREEAAKHKKSRQPAPARVAAAWPMPPR